MKKIKYLVVTLLAVSLFSGIFYLHSLMDIITGYAAKNLCSAVFVSGRDADTVQAIDLNFMPIKFTSNKIDYDEKSVTSRFLWATSKAIYREGVGSVILRGAVDEAALKSLLPMENGYAHSLADTIDWPLGDRVSTDFPTNVNMVGLDSIASLLVDSSFYSGTPFSFMVLYKGTPVVERYKEGITPTTRLLSWSMAKSFVNTLAGVMTQQGMVDIYAPVAISEWQQDARKEITLNNLLQMNSGLEWDENYGNTSDVNIMLHESEDMARYAYAKPLASKPATSWNYSSGSTNIASFALMNQFESPAAYYDFMENQLFQPLGIRNAIFERDLSGTPIASSYIYATTRDFARFGLLYLQNGVYANQQILPEGWVDYTTQTAAGSNGAYGSCFWLNKNHNLPDVPEDSYSCNGHDGQRIFIVPSHELVIVQLGYSPKSNPVDFNRLVKDVIAQVELN